MWQSHVIAIRKQEHEKLKKYQELKEELERIWGVKASVVPVVIGADCTHQTGRVSPTNRSSNN